MGSGCWRVGVGLVRGRRGNGWGGGGQNFFAGGGSCRITDTSKKPQPERQIMFAHKMIIAIFIQSPSSEAFFALPIKCPIPKITDIVKPHRKRCFRQGDFGARNVWGGGVGEGWEGGEGAGALGGRVCSMGSGGAGLVGVEWNCAGVRVGEILRQVEC